MDKRLLNLSYSGRLSLHSCPRRFQLEKLSATPDNEESINQSITYCFGHVVGLGVQLYLEGSTTLTHTYTVEIDEKKVQKTISRKMENMSVEDCVIANLFLFWKPDLFAVNDKQKKSFWLAIAAVQQFISMRKSGYLSDWELVNHNGKPATELSFCITLPNNYRYRGSVDAVLKNRVTGQVMVLECKTSSSPNLNPAQYKNSAQAVGYGVVLDNIFPDVSSYEVLYLVYLTKSQVWEQLPFTKSYLQRALWIQELLLDCEILDRYENSGVYPMHGESCYDYYSECNFLQTCTLATNLLTRPMTPEEEEAFDKKEQEWQLVVSVADLIKSQLDREVGLRQPLIETNEKDEML